MISRHDLAYGSLDTPADIVKRLQYLEPAFEFRQQYYYNNHVSTVLERHFSVLY